MTTQRSRLARTGNTWKNYSQDCEFVQLSAGLVGVKLLLEQKNAELLAKQIKAALGKARNSNKFRNAKIVVEPHWAREGIEGFPIRLRFQK